MMSGKKKINEKVPKVVEEIAQIIEKGLEQFSERERKIRLDRIHSILAGRKKQRRATTNLSPTS
jgi:hypothetical protein